MLNRPQIAHAVIKPIRVEAARSGFGPRRWRLHGALNRRAPAHGLSQRAIHLRPDQGRVVGAGLGCRVAVRKITRCSERGAVLADLLSKARFSEAAQLGREEGGCWESEPVKVPAQLLCWVAEPRPDDSLGHRLLEFMAASGVPILGYSREFQC